MSSTESRDLLDTPEAGPAAIRGGALRVGGYMAGVLLSVGSAALLFRHLGVADAGRYVTVLALVSIVAGLTDVGLTSIGVRELAVRAGDERHRLVRSIIGLRIALTSAGVVGAVAFAAAAGYDSTLVVGTLLAGIGLVVQNLQSTLGIALMVRLRLGWVTLLELIRQVVNCFPASSNSQNCRTSAGPISAFACRCVMPAFSNRSRCRARACRRVPE